MSARRLRICLVALIIGLTCFLLAVWVPRSPRRTADTAAPPVQDAAPSTPPHAPPPGRPFRPQPLAYTGAVPDAADLRSAVEGANVIICVLDAARADHFGAYGYPRDTTPNFDRLAGEGVLFEQHFCEAPETHPSTISLLTGEYPDTHGQLTNGPAQVSVAGRWPALTLEGAFADAGFSTYLVSSSKIVTPEFGIGRDFQEQYFVEDPRTRPHYSRQPEGRGTLDLITALGEQLDQVAGQWKRHDARFFAYFHVYPPHDPYVAPERFQSPFRGKQPPYYWRARTPTGIGDAVKPGEPKPGDVWLDLYDANMRWADSFLGHLEETLRKSGLLEHTLLIVTADHGEAMREHGYAFHINCPYDETLHIPLLVRFPRARVPRGRVYALTQTIDLFPTFLDLFRIAGSHPGLQGKSLLPLLTGEVPKVNDFLVSRTTGDTCCYTVRDAHYALLLHAGAGGRALYDLDDDPWETIDLYRKERARASALERAFASFARGQRYPPTAFPDLTPAVRAPKPPLEELTSQQQRVLHSLGYAK